MQIKCNRPFNQSPIVYSREKWTCVLLSSAISKRFMKGIISAISPKVPFNFFYRVLVIECPLKSSSSFFVLLLILFIHQKNIPSGWSCVVKCNCSFFCVVFCILFVFPLFLVSFLAMTLKFLCIDLWIGIFICYLSSLFGITCRLV